jgi:TolB-like protein
MIIMFSACVVSFPTQAEEKAVVDDQQEETSVDKPWRKKKEDDKEKKDKPLSDEKKFKLMAQSLLGRPHWSDRFLNLLDAETPKIALHPFKEDELPFSLEEANQYANGFAQALIKEADGRYAVVGRKELGAVISDLNEMGGRSDSVNPLGDLIDRARSDLLAVGSLSLNGDQINLSYKLVETETGRIVSVSQKNFKRKEAPASQSAGGLSIKGAAQKAAHQLLRDVSAIRKIMVQGLRYQTSGIHSTFGRYFMEVMSDQLRAEANSGPHNINSLEISDFVIEEENFRGLQLQKGSVENAVLNENTQNYLLKGTYWVFDQQVEIRLNLIGANGSSVAWRGYILKSEIPQSLSLVPPSAPVDEEDNKTLGPIDLYLSSNKGQNPLFKIGQNMVLAVRTKTDAYINCFYLQSDGAIFKILPNRFIPTQKMIGGFMQHIPSAAMTFQFEMTPPTGVEAVKCFATDRDVSRDVVAEIGNKAFEPLTIKNERELTKIYRNLDGVMLSEASLIVTVQ